VKSLKSFYYAPSFRSKNWTCESIMFTRTLDWSLLLKDIEEMPYLDKAYSLRGFLMSSIGLVSRFCGSGRSQTLRKPLSCPVTRVLLSYETAKQNIDDVGKY
jgi:hypothetical protein